MTKHEVNIGSQVRSSAAMTANDGTQGEESNVIDVSHLRPVSEGVLRRAGLHGGDDVNGNLRDKRNEFGGAVDIDPSTLPSDEPHVQLMRLQHQTQGIVTRDLNRDGSITLSLIHGEGDITSVRAATDAEAQAALIEKAGGLK